MSVAQVNLQHLLREIKSLKVKLDALGAPDAACEQGLWNKLRLDWTFHSCRLAGIECSYLEAELLLFSSSAPDNGAFTELEAHDEAVRQVRAWAAARHRLTEHDVLALNGSLTGQAHQALTDDDIRTDEEDSAQLTELLRWCQLYSFDLHPLLLAVEWHSGFAHLRRKYDGRLPRLLLNLPLLEQGYPPVIVLGDDGAAYRQACQEALHGNNDALAAYFARQLIRSLELALRAARGERVDESSDWEKELTKLEKTLVAETDKKTRSADLLLHRIDDSFEPLLRAIQLKTARFDRLFGQVQRRYRLELPGRTEQIMPENFRTTLTELSEQHALSELREINLIVRWSNFLYPSTAPFDLELMLKIQLEPYHYAIYAPDQSQKLAAKAYSLPLLPEELENIIESAGRFLTEKMPPPGPLQRRG